MLATGVKKEKPRTVGAGKSIANFQTKLCLVAIRKFGAFSASLSPKKISPA